MEREKEEVLWVWPQPADGDSGRGSHPPCGIHREGSSKKSKATDVSNVGKVHLHLQMMMMMMMMMMILFRQ